MSENEQRTMTTFGMLTTVKELEAKIEEVGSLLVDLTEILGRLFHSDYEGKHIILMTTEEYQRYKKRLYAIYEKGFEIKVYT